MFDKSLNIIHDCYNHRCHKPVDREDGEGSWAFVGEARTYGRKFDLHYEMTLVEQDFTYFVFGHFLVLR